VLIVLCGVLIYFIYFYFFEKLCQKGSPLRLEVMKKPTSFWNWWELMKGGSNEKNNAILYMKKNVCQKI